MNLDRVGPSQLNDDHVFSLEAVHNLEYNHIIESIRREANEAMSQEGATVEQALHRLPSVLSHVRDVFAKDLLARDPDLLRAAARGELTKHLPSRAAMVTLLLLGIVSALAELGMGVAMWRISDNIFLVLIALFLVVAGWLQGLGLAGVLKRAFPSLPREIDRSPPEERLGLPVILIIAGTGIMALLSYLRARGDDEGAGTVVAVTVSLAMLVAVAEGLYLFMKHRYEYIKERMFHCQVWYATDQHAKKCGEGGSYATQYESHVRRLG